ncbi:MAG: toxin [Candidatus Anammoxibacter sp.]
MVIWDEEKSIKLKIERDISFELIADIILNKKYIDILENPSNTNQNIFVVEIKNYIYAVPFILDEESNIVLKTAYPSRKLNKKYGDKYECAKRS